MAPPALQVVGVHRAFGGTRAVAGVDLTVGQGEYVCILGPSGSGKSTLLRLIAGFETPDRGEIHLGGRPVDGLPPEGRAVHTVFQGYALFPHMNVFQNVAFGLRMRGTGRSEVHDRVAAALDMVGLSGFAPRFPAGLSGGEQQRVALARALVNRPPLLLLDEPLAALDRKLRLRMQDELRRIQQELGIAFLHVTHDQEEALRLSDRVAVMDGGRILQMGDPGEVYHHPRTPFVADFLGAANLLEGTIGEGEGAPTLHLRGGGHLNLPSGTPVEGPDRVWALRPGSIRLVPASGTGDDDPEPCPGLLRGRVEARLPLGGVDELRVRVGGDILRVHLLGGPGRTLPAVGEDVTLSVAPDDLVPLDPG